ncbi:hypothetical protein [Paenibacillus cookii]|uniref:hypothetical protein n=1 Tax=Paenibacillus cookii TaxID=157839 RepID=UPI001BB3D700|nr:hypothetical protein [Paenibacillus cookii]
MLERLIIFTGSPFCRTAVPSEPIFEAFVSGTAWLSAAAAFAGKTVPSLPDAAMMPEPVRIQPDINIAEISKAEPVWASRVIFLMINLLNAPLDKNASSIIKSSGRQDVKVSLQSGVNLFFFVQHEDLQTLQKRGNEAFITKKPPPQNVVTFLYDIKPRRIEPPASSLQVERPFKQELPSLLL